VAEADHRAGRKTADRELLDAGLISRRDNLTNLLLLQRSAGSGDVLAMIRDADIAMRTHPATWATIMPALIQEAKDVRFARILAAQTAVAPWRPAFLRTLNGDRDHADAAFHIYTALHEIKKGPSAEEAAEYFTTAQFWIRPDELRRRWLMLDPAVQPNAAKRYPYDGSFLGLGGSAPFNWALGSGDGLAVAMANNQLEIRFDGAGSITAAKQLLALPAGKHRLHLQGRSIGGQEYARLELSIYCADGTPVSTVTIAVPMLSHRGELDMDVPARCVGQWLALDINREIGDPPVDIALSHLLID